MPAPAHDLATTLALLQRTPAALRALLTGLPGTWTEHNEGGETWTVRDVVGHLLYGETANWMPRARVILAGEVAEPFAAFDRLGHQTASAGRSLHQLLEEFAAARADNISALEALALQPEQLAMRGTHPAFGTVTLSELLATWAVHDLTHLAQIARVMAAQYREQVGPWQAYLGVLRRSIE